MRTSDGERRGMNRRQQRNRTRTAILSIALAVITYLAGKLAVLVATRLGIDPLMVGIATRSVVAVGGIVALGGSSWLRFDAHGILQAWSFSKQLIIINICIGTITSLGVIAAIHDGRVDPARVLPITAYVTVLCMLVGINEEGMFRGLVFGGLLARMGGTEGGPLRAAIIASVSFGLVHVVFSLDPTNVYSIASGIMKTLECSMFALILCIPVLESRNLLGAMTVHAFFDWVIMLGNAITTDGVSIPSYTSTDPRIALSSIVVFSVLCVCYLPKTIRAVKELRGIELPRYGPFVG